MARHLTRHLRPHATKVLIVYSKATGVVRRVYDMDHDVDYPHLVSLLHPGEGHLFLSHALYDGHSSLDHLKDTVAKHAGFKRAPHHHADRHELLDHDGDVMGVFHLDPTCGDHPAHLGGNSFRHAPDAHDYYEQEKA